MRKWRLFKCNIDLLILSKIKILNVVNLSLFFNVRTWIQSKQWLWLKKRVLFFHIDFHEIIIIRQWFVFCRFHVSIDFMRDSISKRISNDQSIFFLAYISHYKSHTLFSSHRFETAFKFRFFVSRRKCRESENERSERVSRVWVHFDNSRRSMHNLWQRIAENSESCETENENCSQ